MEQKGEKREQDAEKYQSRSVYVCESRCEAPWKPGQGSRYDVYQTVGYHGFPERAADYSPGDVHRFEKSGSFIGDVCVKHERGHEHYEQEYQWYEYYAYYRNSQKDNRRYQYHEHGYAHEQYAQTVEYQFSGAVFEKRYYLPERWLSAVFFLKYHVRWGEGHEYHETCHKKQVAYHQKRNGPGHTGQLAVCYVQ